MAFVAAALAAAAHGATALKYPATPRIDTYETHFGVRVDDPYRWLENDVRNDPRVRQWVDAENEVTNAYLATLPRRAAIEERLRELWNFEKFTLPQERGGKYFFQRNDGLQNQFALYVQESLTAAPRLLIDPNTWSKDGATALAEWSASPDGRHVAYTIQDGGSDWRTVRVIDVATGEVAKQELQWAKFTSVDWLADSSGFFYSRFPAPEKGQEFQSLNLNQSVYLHRLGTAQADDRLVFATPDRPKLLHGTEITDDGRWLLIQSVEGTDERYEVSLLDLRDPKAVPRLIVPGFEHSFDLIGNQGDTIFLKTNKGASNYRIVKFDARAKGPVNFIEVVPESKSLLEDASVVGDKLIASYLEDAKSVVRVFGLDGAARGAVQLPGIGYAAGFSGEYGNDETFYSYSSFNSPPALYRYDAATGASTVFKAPKTPFDASQYVVRQVFFPSKDGTKVPMFIAHRKGLDLSKGAPTLLYGYGGFNISLPPAFSTSRLAWMEMGGVYAVANLRGGGEYGKTWHDAGRLLEKQNVFDDFIAAGEFLIREGVTTKDQLAILGGSNGGLLVGAVVNQRPDLFAAALPAVGVMDMLRYDQFTAGRYWVDDYGAPSDEKYFAYLRGYSPYHNIRGGKDYPAILVTTADTDDRVVPGHSFKYAAALQAADIGPKPHLIRIETRAGHGSGKPTEKIIEEFADQWAFIAEHTGMNAKAPAGADGH